MIRSDRVPNSKFLQNIFRGPGLLLNLKLENPLRKTLLLVEWMRRWKRGGRGYWGGLVAVF